MHHSFADGSVTMALRQTTHDDSITPEITEDAKKARLVSRPAL